MDGTVEAIGSAAALEGEVGQTLGRSAPFVIDQFAEDVFAALIGDFDPMHNDPHWHFDAGWDGTIVLGFHVLSLVERFLAEVGLPVAGNGRETFVTRALGRVRFVSPLPVGAEAQATVRLSGIERRDGETLVRTTIETHLRETARLTMIADHIGAFRPRDTREAASDDSGAIRIEEVPDGHAVPHTDTHDEAFYRALADRSRDWLGSTPWTTIDRRSDDVFALLTSSGDHLRRQLSSDRTAVSPLHLLSLRAYFLPQVGLPVLSDEHMAAFNYGLDGVRWYGSVAYDTPIRDHIRLLEVREKQTGRFLVRTRHVLEAQGHEMAVMIAESLSLFVVRGENPA